MTAAAGGLDVDDVAYFCVLGAFAGEFCGFAGGLDEGGAAGGAVVVTASSSQAASVRTNSSGNSRFIARSTPSKMARVALPPSLT